MAYPRPGDTLAVLALDPLARSLQDLITLVGDLRRAGIGFRSPYEALDATTPTAGSCSTSSPPWPSSTGSRLSCCRNFRSAA
ncbi:recombinase family protein [Nocardiopsis sp. CT-R113]|uniref:Recombinase family protein n=1 Tax=Nocardiopsis codii TaxID=3065942 RepID=A0ABU7KG80_9ACTN|nr:recombinase family protein [Nocardiopsis sp. CT-R113]